MFQPVLTLNCVGGNEFHALSSSVVLTRGVARSLCDSQASL